MNNLTDIPISLFETELTIYEKMVCTYLYRCLNRENAPFPSYSLIAKDCSMSRRKAITTVQELTVKNIIKFDKIIKTSEEKRELLISKNLKGLGIGNNVCEWCKCKTITLHLHHYPILKSKGGADTVSICPNCHTEFHSFDSKSNWEI